MKDNKIKSLSDREHLLLRPAIFIGAVDNSEIEDYFLENDKIVYRKVQYVPALIKMVNEIIDNSCDEAIRTDFKFANKISIQMTKNQVIIEDNGRGIPIEIEESTGEYMPVLAWGRLRSGSNFEDDDNRITLGLNGVGSACTNIFSSEFIGETHDGKKKLIFKCWDNLNNNDISVGESKIHKTLVSFKPDFSRFETDKFNETYFNIIKQRLLNLAITFPKIQFKFNNEIIKTKTFKQYVQYFNPISVIYEDIQDKYFIAILPNDTDDFKQYTFINGLYVKSGGNHIDYITGEVVNKVRDLISRKYKNIKPGDIKNKLQLIVFFREFKNFKTDSQTKEKLTNSVSEIKKFLGDIDFTKIARTIFKTPDIIDPITETYKIKEELKKRQELKSLSSTSKKVKIEKYMPPTIKHKYLVICEGQSAMGGISQVLGREEFGYYPLKGKILNVLNADTKKVTNNQEVQDLFEILGLQVGTEIQQIKYDYILIATDADLDGISISSLLLAFFEKFAPSLIQTGKIFRLKTPIVAAKKNNKIIHPFFTLQEYKEFRESNKIKYEYQYYKGLGSHTERSLQETIQSVGGLKNCIDPFETISKYNDYILGWMKSDQVQYRKELLKGVEFDVNAI